MKYHTTALMAHLEALLLSICGPAFMLFNDGAKLSELRDELATLSQQAQNIQARADAEKRALSDEESKEIEGIFARFEYVEAEIERREQIEANAARLKLPAGRVTDPNDAGDTNGGAKPGVRPKAHREPRDPADVGKHGFRSFGEFAQAVKSSVRSTPGGVDPRLVANAPTTASTEGTGADGGWAVPPDFRSSIIVKVMGEESLVARTDRQTSSSNSLTLPIDETSPWQTSGGIQAAWENELAQANQSKLALSQVTLRLNKLTALIPVTEELMEDASALTSYIATKTPQKFDFKLQDAILNGTGAGQPTGILASNALVTVAKESGQAADTIVFANIVNMWARMYAPCRRNAVWLINQDIEPQLLSMAFPGTGTAVPVYLPPGGLSGQPYGSLMGRPVIPVQACDTLGDLGDIVLADLTQYMTVTKTQGLRQDVSMHLWFDYDTLAFRFILRFAGMPWWNAAITPKNSANTLSCFVTLAARS